MDFNVRDSFEELVNILKKHTEQISFDINLKSSNIPKEYPESIRELLSVASEINLDWSFDFELEEFEDVNFGEVEFGVDSFDFDNLEVWAESVIDLNMPLNLNSAFPLQSIINGDMLVLSERGAVFYLNHEIPESSVRLGLSLISFYETWIKLCCPGPEWWCLEPFYDTENQYLSSELPSSKRWLELLNSQ
ncbi:MAG: hypothetical protein HRT88_06140 [Lentisphaeraceae bacterium]|nr:hypothetical protein [Lentisphaeraceae bacterium]